MVEWDVPVGRELLSHTMPLIRGEVEQLRPYACAGRGSSFGP